MCLKILNFGSCNIDCVYRVEHLVTPGETCAAVRRQVYVGGKGLNQSVALAQAGIPVFHAGCVGEDGGMLRTFMQERGVDLRYLKTVAQPSGHAIIQVDEKGENGIFIYGGANAAVDRPYIDEVLSHFEKGDILLLQNEISERPYLIDSAASRGMRIVLNPSPFDEELRETALHKLAYLILNETEAAAFCGMPEQEAFITWVRERYPQLRVVLTLGKRGSLYFDRLQVLRQPAFAVETVDTTAAGDTFTGYFAAALYRDAPLKTALRYAAAAAALAVSAHGAAPSIPTAAAVEAALPQLRPLTFDALSLQQQTVQTYFERHWQDATQKGLAAALGYAPSYVGRWLRQHMGASFAELLLRARCREMARLLETTELPVSACIAMTGYANETFVRTAFCREYGVSPRQYRKKWEEKGRKNV